MPIAVTVFIAKLLKLASRLSGRGDGSALPGLVAERIDPGIGRQLAAKLPRGSIIITGTNGKTTTAKMVAAILKAGGEKLVLNPAGSNLSRGVVSALVSDADWGGRLSAEQGLMEVDEAAMPAVSAMLNPKAIVVLNLFRDQLDRYGELDSTAALIGQAIADSQAQVYLNADDPLVASLAKYAVGRVHFFGLADAPVAKLAHDVTADSANCPVCGQALEYSVNWFGHMGHYRCPQKHFGRPAPEYEAVNVQLDPEGSSAEVKSLEETFNITLKLPGIYNLYNALAAAALADGLGQPAATISQALLGVQAAFGRVEAVRYRGRELYLLLVKNPTGFNQIIQTFLLSKKQQHLLIVINDNFADGRDVSWLWDVAFEELAKQGHRITVSGQRATDMALRLKYAGLPEPQVVPKVERALKQFVESLPPDQTGYVIPTYTAMLQARKIIGGRALRGAE